MATKKLAMDTTTIGYSKEGIEALKKVISTAINDGANNVDPNKSKAFKTLSETLNAYWDGIDEQNFENDIKAMATSLAAKLRTYDTVISAALTSYANQFGKFQQSTYTKGSVKL